ncbi:MAG: DUF2889 domain-containing protein [Streptosporangiales bacterium]|nr:DUF2889 domain-containing protein [Streptosporangiales bacterium]
MRVVATLRDTSVAVDDPTDVELIHDLRLEATITVPDLVIREVSGHAEHQPYDQCALTIAPAGGPARAQPQARVPTSGDGTARRAPGLQPFPDTGPRALRRQRPLDLPADAGASPEHPGEPGKRHLGARGPAGRARADERLPRARRRLTGATPRPRRRAD